MNTFKKLFLIAAEPSGDSLGADFIEEVRKLNPNIEIAGMGGEKMAQAGVPSLVPIEGLSILGLVEALSVWKLAKQKAKAIAEYAAKFKPDAVVLIDSWGFTLRCATEIRKLDKNIKLIKMVGPQVWATRAGRAKTLAKAYDAIWCIHEFELPFYEGLGIEAKVIGNPALGRVEIGDGIAFKARHNLENKKIIGLLPGSRRKEIELLMPVIREVVAKYGAINQDLVFVTIAANSIKNLLQTGNCDNWLVVDETEKLDAFASMDVAFACSGTVTSELAIAGVPLVVGYKIDAFTYFIVRNFLLKTKFVTLINVAAGYEIIKELLQENMTTENVIEYLKRILNDDNLRNKQILAQNDALQSMGLGKEKAAHRAAQYLLNLA